MTYNPKHPVLPWANSSPGVMSIGDYGGQSGALLLTRQVYSKSIGTVQCAFAPSWGRLYATNGLSATSPNLFVWDVSPDFKFSPASGGGLNYTYFTNNVVTTSTQWATGAICYDPSRDKIFYVTYTGSIYSLKSAAYNSSTGFDTIVEVKTYGASFSNGSEATMFWCPYDGYIYTYAPARTYAGGATSSVMVINPNNGTIVTSFAAFNYSMTYCTATEKIYAVGGPSGQYGGSTGKGWCIIDPSNNSVAFYTGYDANSGNCPVMSATYHPRRGVVYLASNSGSGVKDLIFTDPKTPASWYSVGAKAASSWGVPACLVFSPVGGDLMISYTSGSSEMYARLISPSSAKWAGNNGTYTSIVIGGGVVQSGFQSFLASYTNATSGTQFYAAPFRAVKATTT